MIGHRKFERMIPLLLYHELTERQVHELNEHLAACESCRKNLDSTRDLHVLLERAPAPAVQDAAIRETRSQALAAVRAAARDRHALSPAFTAPTIRWALVAGSVVILSAAFFAGRLTAPGPDLPFSAEGDVRVTNIRLSGDAGRTIEATFDLVKPVRVRGSIDDPQVQKVLASALVNAENPGVRLRAVSGVASGDAMPADREVRTALMLATRKDPNDAVRKEALHALLRYPPDREIRDVLLEVLTHDPNAGLRIVAINGLDSLRLRGFGPDAAQLRSVRKGVESEQNLYVRVRSRSILEEKQQ
jgi:predicted anti-sigma-YlaC factor YlaD